MFIRHKTMEKMSNFESFGQLGSGHERFSSMKRDVCDFRTRAALRSSTAISVYRRFAKNDDGVMTIFACFMIMIMLFFGGIGVDLMRNEMERARLQGIADRAALAATSIDQTLEAEDVVNDYFAKSGISDYVVTTTPSDRNSENFRSITVSASKTMNTLFIDRFGVDSMNIPVRSSAEESIPNVEISLVLDVSASMRDANRLVNLKPAAKNFINAVLRGNAAASTSVNIVPYGGGVNPGPFMFNRLHGVRYPAMALDEAQGGIPEASSHVQLPPSVPGGVGSDPNVRYVFPNVSSCLNLQPSDYLETRLPSASSYDQVPIFTYWDAPYDDSAQPLTWGQCPRDATQIKYMSNDAEALNSMIDGLHMSDGTGGQEGMLWGAAMLDPSSQDDVRALIGAGLASPEFADRPAPYDQPDSIKYIVLMTDGMTTAQYRPVVPMDPRNLSERLGNRREDVYRMTSKPSNIQRLVDLCTLAKNKQPRGVIIYTIAFETKENAKVSMRECASSPSHFFDTNGAGISDVFQAIAGQINELRLTQ